MFYPGRCSPELCHPDHACAWKPFFKIHVNLFMAWDDSLCVNVISKRVLWVRGSGCQSLDFGTFPFSN